MPKPVRSTKPDSDLLGLKTVIVHVGPVGSTRRRTAPRDMLIEGNKPARLRNSIAARALLLIVLGSASWAAVAASASLVRRVIA